MFSPLLVQAAWLQKEDVTSWSHAALLAYSKESLSNTGKGRQWQRLFQWAGRPLRGNNGITTSLDTVIKMRFHQREFGQQKKTLWILFEYWLRKIGSWDAIELDFGISKKY